MQIPTDPQSTAILRLEARMHAQKVILAILCADNPAALNAVRRYAAISGDVASQFLLTDDQLDIYKKEFDQLVEGVDKFVAFLQSRDS
jgi:hypothetical protein